MEIKGGKPYYGLKKEQRYIIQNALSELDQAGEWYLDRNTGVLYMCPLGKIEPDAV